MEGRRLTRISRTVAADPRPAPCFFSFRFSYFSGFVGEPAPPSLAL